MAQQASHKSVLLEEVANWLSPVPGGRYLDATLGLGGHSMELLERTAGKIEIVGLDRDRQALEQAEKRLASYRGKVCFAHLPFSRFEDALDEAGWDAVDGAVADLGVSSMQLDQSVRGFSFLADGPLDMRMDPDSGLEPASRLVNRASAERLKQILREYGEEPMCGRIARAIVKARGDAPIETTSRLADIVERAYPAKWRRTARTHPATRTFQALRIAVNDELGELSEFLERIPGRFKPGGRVAVISFHSLEDRMVKRSFRDMARDCTCPPRTPVCVCGAKRMLTVLTKKPITPSSEEETTNARARSAKLRVAQRFTDVAEETSRS
jgi:16S rRNA (cytosine1402-N4)-methyltransferase